MKMKKILRGFFAAVLATAVVILAFAGTTASAKADQLDAAVDSELTAVTGVLNENAAEVTGEEKEEADVLSANEAEDVVAAPQENGGSTVSIRYDGPKEAFENVNKPFVTAAKLVAGLFNLLKEKFGVAGFIGGIVLAVALIVLFLIAMSVMFKKAGVPAWLAFIPFVDVFYCFKIGWEKEKTWTLLIGLALFYVFGFIGGIKEMQFGSVVWDVPGIIGTICGLLKIIGVIILIVYTLRLAQGIAEGFGLHFSFGIGLWLLPIIFVPILAFVPTKYVYALGTGQVKVE